MLVIALFNERFWLGRTLDLSMHNLEIACLNA